MVARRKTDAKKDSPQGALDLASAGESNVDDPVDIGGEEEMDESFVDEE